MQNHWGCQPTWQETEAKERRQAYRESLGFFRGTLWDIKEFFLNYVLVAILAPFAIAVIILLLIGWQIKQWLKPAEPQN